MMFSWGIIGLGRIARKFAVELLETKLGKVGAVASRDISKAQDFAAEFGGQAFGSYEDFIAHARVDAVYIAVPHHLHFSLSLACIQASRPVLCEKPFTIHSKELEILIQAARTHNVFLMEAMWTRFMPHIRWIQDEFLQGTWGKLLHLKAEFCFKGKERGHQLGLRRLLENELGGGALMDVGIYPVFLSHLFFGPPLEIQAQASIENQIDESCQVLTQYAGGATAVLDSSILWQAEGRAELFFDQATIVIPSRWHESNEIIIHKPDTPSETKKWNYPSRGFYFQTKEVQDCLAQGKIESTTMPLDFSLAVMQTMDSIRKRINLTYPADTK
jgi:predicted dehydrogenase